MSDSTGDRAYARDAKRQGASAWLGLFLFFAGCAALTVAAIYLNIDDSTSAVLASAGAVALFIGVVLVWWRGNLRGVQS